MSSYQKVIQTSVDASGVTEHQIRLVPVEAIQRGIDSSDESGVEEEEEEEDNSSDEEMEEEVQIIQTVVSIPSTSIEPNQVNCMFCYGPVQKFNTKKPYSRKLLNNTCQRLFKYICDHLAIENPTVPNRGLQKPPKAAQLLPAYLPLCARCRELYYNNIYESFVTYEEAVIKLADQIAACITRAIGSSAKQNKQSVDGGHAVNPTEDIFDAYEKSMNEHEVMRAVRQFRQKVVDKNPAGFMEEPEPTSKKYGRGRPKGGYYVPAVPTASDPIATPPDNDGVDDDTTVQVVGPDLKNVIKIVKNRTDILQRERTMERVSNRLDIVKQEMDDEIDGIEPSSSSSSAPDLNYYAVSNPAPGVIQIIPVVVGENGEAIPSMNVKAKSKKRKRTGREDYQKQRIALNTCKFCNKYFPGPSLLIRHQVRKHGMEKPERCPQCDYRGIDKASLKSHMSTHLQGDEREKAKKFHCHICGLKFKGKSGLNGHLRSHAGEKPFVCDECGKAFTSGTSRQLCMDKHKGIKHHKCAYCEKTFLRKEVLKIHERTHTGEKPFKCGICGKAFAQRSPLNIHLRMHKKKDSIKKERAI